MANTRSTSKIDLDDAAVLRAQLEIELKNKKQCTYQTYECTQLCLDGYKFCSKHILQDKNAPFKQCSYIYSSNGKRCHVPAQRVDKRDYGYCSEHALKATLARNKQNAKNPPPRTAESLLHSLSHYVAKPRLRSSSSSTQYSEENASEETKINDPFLDIDASTVFNEKCNEVLDFCSESDSDVEASTFSSVWHDAQADSSDNESIDSEQEDLLKHANVFTGEEVTLITRDKLVRLQSLYIEQYRHLQYLLTEKRRKYLHSLKRERETCCNIASQVHDNPKEQRLYKKLKALNNYQKCHGTDGILNKKLKDLRVKISEGNLSKAPTYSKCLFTEGGVKCGERSIPLSKYCQKHILEDVNQVLYRPCGKTMADVTCTTPIAAIFEESTCHLHLEIPVLRSYSQPRKDSESDIDETVDAHLQYSSQLSEDIKNEFINYVPPEIPKMETLPTMLFEENSTSNNEVINESDFLFENDQQASETDGEFNIESQGDFVDMPDCLSAEVEISTELDENLAREGSSDLNMVEDNSTKIDASQNSIQSDVNVMDSSISNIEIDTPEVGVNDVGATIAKEDTSTVSDIVYNEMVFCDTRNESAEDVKMNDEQESMVDNKNGQDAIVESGQASTVKNESDCVSGQKTSEVCDTHEVTGDVEMKDDFEDVKNKNDQETSEPHDIIEEEPSTEIAPGLNN